MKNKISLMDHAVIYHIEDKMSSMGWSMVVVVLLQKYFVVQKLLLFHWHLDCYNKCHLREQLNDQYQSQSEKYNRERIGSIFIK